MNETTDPNNQILLVGIIAFYWALLSSWGLTQPRQGNDKAKRDDAPTSQRSDSDERRAAADTSLDGIRKIDPDFDVAAFLAGAKAAYETILRAYADSDIQTLKRLVGPEVLDAFELAIAGRRDRKETLHLTFIGTSEAKIVDTLEEDGAAEIVVRYVSELVSVTRSVNNEIVAGDPEQIVGVIDRWTFACETRSMKRNWMLVATSGE
ncbi:Tim44/TimA family putative adaptor protein [Mesorhizobium sp. WSM3224]|uniref:Tim44/TimA family putative adaptor protein n=1 Tax=Mesorhizobium sp. WSM3224 TaxID=1040986 RepID=UPI0006842B2E|nr:Tim44/TimA family putative adaptor protein [Mesorhizobium sp. WSM3224]